MIARRDHRQPRKRIDWKSVRGGIDLARVAADLLGPAPGRRGEWGDKLWWSCPFHKDLNPSFCIEPGKSRWKCFGCGEKGNVVDLVMRRKGCKFPEAVAYLTGGPAPSRVSWPRTAPSAVSRATPNLPETPEGEGMSGAEAEALVSAAVERLWSPEGAEALAYLTGPDRLLRPETIRATRLGFAPSVRAVTKDGHAYQARGVVVPWYAGGRLTLVKVRQPEGRRPKYAEVYRDRARHVGLYPGPAAIRPGCPLVIVEGEFDALLLAQELGELAAVATLGSASARPEPAILGRMIAAAPWYVATDNDRAGDKSAEGWPAASRRVRPPGRFKDWTEVKGAGVDLARWWRDILAGAELPPLFTWEELSPLRWGPGIDDEPGPGLDVR